MTDDVKLPSAMDIRAICETIPHRYPFLLVDRVLELDTENLAIKALKNVTMNEPQFTGHYPDMPVMPGVLMIEALAQTAAIFLLSIPDNKGKVPFFAAVDAVKFRRQVGPGDQLVLEARVTKMKKRVSVAEARATVNGEVAVEAKLTCMLGDAPE